MEAVMAKTKPRAMLTIFIPVLEGMPDANQQTFAKICQAYEDYTGKPVPESGKKGQRVLKFDHRKMAVALHREKSDLTKAFRLFGRAYRTALLRMDRTPPKRDPVADDLKDQGSEGSSTLSKKEEPTP